MGMYMYPIQIDKKPKTIKFTKSVTIYDGYLTLDKISKHVSDGEKFDVYKGEENLHGSAYTLEIYCSRLEAESETAARVAKEKRYMVAYKKFHEDKG